MANLNSHISQYAQPTNPHEQQEWEAGLIQRSTPLEVEPMRYKPLVPYQEPKMEMRPIGDIVADLAKPVVGLAAIAGGVYLVVQIIIAVGVAVVAFISANQAVFAGAALLVFAGFAFWVSRGREDKSGSGESGGKRRFFYQRQEQGYYEE